MMKLFKEVNDTGNLSIYFNELDYEDDYDMIRDILLEAFDCKLLRDIAVDVRIAEFKKNGARFALVYDSAVGNLLSSEKTSDEAFLHELRQSVIDYIKANKLLPVD